MKYVTSVYLWYLKLSVTSLLCSTKKNLALQHARTSLQYYNQLRYFDDILTSILTFMKPTFLLVIIYLDKYILLSNEQNKYTIIRTVPKYNRFIWLYLVHALQYNVTEVKLALCAQRNHLKDMIRSCICLISKCE